MMPFAQQVCAQFESPHVPATQLSARVMFFCSAPQSLLLAHEAQASLGVPQSTAYVLSTDEQGGLTQGADGGEYGEGGDGGIFGGEGGGGGDGGL